MSTFVRFVFSTAVVALIVAGTLSAQAQLFPPLEEGAYSPFTTIRYIRQSQTNGDDNTYVALNGVTCGSGTELFFDASAPAHESMVDSALAAFLSSRQVLVVHYGCRIQSVWVR